MNDADTLRDRASDLLMHHEGRGPIRPDLVVVQGDRPGWHGVALVLDGGYGREDAEQMVTFWRGVLADTLDALGWTT